MRHLRTKEGGFTLIELTFVISIFAIMASILLFNFKNFGTQASLDNLAQDVALRILTAQKAAISGALTSGVIATDSTNRPSYGMYFVAGTAATTLAKQFTYFTDLLTPRNHLYDVSAGCTPGPLTECLSITSITTGEYVSTICYFAAIGGLYHCVPTGALHIAFVRPFPSAYLNICATSGTCSSPIPASSAYIQVTSGVSTAIVKTIIITSLGQVRVFNGGADQAAGCPAGSGC